MKFLCALTREIGKNSDKKASRNVCSKSIVALKGKLETFHCSAWPLARRRLKYGDFWRPKFSFRIHWCKMNYFGKMMALVATDPRARFHSLIRLYAGHLGSASNFAMFMIVPRSLCQKWIHARQLPANSSCFRNIVLIAFLALWFRLA